MDLNQTQPGMHVRPASNDDADALAADFGCAVGPGTIFTVSLVVLDGIDYRGRQCKGVVVEPQKPHMLGGPVKVWAAERFRAMGAVRETDGAAIDAQPPVGVEDTDE